MRKQIVRSRTRKIIAVLTAYTILFQVIYPTCAFALTGGPSQPEVQSFEPVGTSDMVDLFSGDFNYNIPLLDVDGYPINISYHSGISMDQEASWVGLGWNINPGVINRNMRGIPDDFKGDVVTKEFNMKENETIGVNAGVGFELFGGEKIIKSGLNIGIGVSYNNYTGVGIEKSVALSLSAGQKSQSPLNGSLGLTSSSDDGLSIQPSIGLSFSSDKIAHTETQLGVHLGSSFNSRQGLKTLTISTSVSASVIATNKENGTSSVQSAFSKGAAGSFNFMMPTYTPQVTMPMRNTSITANFKAGSALIGAHPNFTVGGYYSKQDLAQTTVNNPAYGYMNADEGVKYDNSLMDFNREGGGAFTASTPDLPLSNFTYDIYSVSGQGAGGSYRPFRSDIGHVFDPAASTTSDGKSIGLEIGWGNVFHVGGDFTQSSVNTYSHRWKNNNNAIERLAYKQKTDDPLYESYYFKEANEKSVDSDPNFFNDQGSYTAEAVRLNKLSDFNTIAENTYTSGLGITAKNYRKSRDKRSQNISHLSKAELKEYGLVDPDELDLYPAKKHHLAEITSLGTDGKRYVYEIGAYNTRQEETSFAVGTNLDGSNGLTGDCGTGLVSYTPGLHNSTSNKSGLDNYYSNTIMPPFAHSYLLSAVLSPDYIDSDTLRGPSDNDMGSYTKFNYTKIPTYKWRIPVESGKATYNEGLKSDSHDDKANYIYGEKELWYLNTIETKNYIAVFKTAPRDDARGVLGKDGGIDTDTAHASRLLQKISLYTKPNYKAHLATGATLLPIKEVHFEYDYSLCKNVGNNVVAGKGKLTLKRIYFTYQNSFKARLSPYEFKYSNTVYTNPDYHIKGYDRWGNYKPNTVTSCDGGTTGLPTAEFPYVNQSNRAQQDSFMVAWTLRSINLPSGGRINVTYESDDYAYVQNKVANQMFLIDSTSAVVDNSLAEPNLKLFFKLQKNREGTYETDIRKYTNGIGYMYFRFLMEFSTGVYDYVSGYSKIVDSGVSGGIGWVQLENVQLNDNGETKYNPIVKAAIQFGRINNPRVMWDQSDITDPTFGESFLNALRKSSFFTTIGDAIDGPNKALFDGRATRTPRCHNFVKHKSWIRLNNPIGSKLGGGARVQSIKISDQWNEMSSTESSFDYGQEYNYNLPDGTSSGVASYEPQLGGDENPWKKPVFFDEQKLLAPDDEHYLEEPFGESFFPSPSVGYSRVTVQNLQRENVHRNATGKVVHEFYTSKDFPTITDRTTMDARQEKSDPFSLSSLFKINVKDYMTASQGYVIELNDMNGKPKSQSVYQESQTVPISSVEYKYKQDSYINGAFRLNNTVTTIANDGTVNKNSRIGVFYDYTSDFRESTTYNQSSAAMANLDAFVIVPPPVVFIFIILPSSTNQVTRFRSAVVTKVVQCFGILEKTIATDLGSTVTTENLAYDAETGEVLLTQTNNDFNDPVYSLTYPAYWYYDGMGAAYQNIGFTSPTSLSFTAGLASYPAARTYFAEGDELKMESGLKAWVTEVNTGSIKAQYKDGTWVNGSSVVTILRSGRRNQQTEAMAKLTTLSNPLNNIVSNVYPKVVQAGSMEFSNSWKTYCDCYADKSLSTNPYILGTKGLWKMKKSYLYLTERDQSNFDNNTNIRKDGMFAAYTPFYKLSGGKWVIDPQNWTFTTEVTEFSPYGVELENKDALGRFSAASYGYNQAYPISVAANSRYRDMGSDNFEDYDFSACADNHFKFNKNTVTINKTQAHTGRRSIQVGSTPVTLTKQLSECVIPIPCNLELRSTYDSVNARYPIKVFGGTFPYAFEYKIVDGQAGVILGAADSLYVNNITSATVSILITVTDAKGCTINKNLVFSKPVTPHQSTGSAVGNAFGFLPPCFGFDASITAALNEFAYSYTVHVTAGTTPIQYTWSPASKIISGQGTNTVQVIRDGSAYTLSLTVTDFNNCTSTPSISVPVINN